MKQPVTMTTDLDQYHLFGNQDPSVDLNGDGSLNFFDVSELIVLYQNGCP